MAAKGLVSMLRVNLYDGPAMEHRPHIIVFNPDQWRGDVMGHLGNPAAMTPNLDRMVATDGVSFRNAFCQNPVCTPSRCSFMTGWYPHVRGHRTMFHMLRPDEPCLLKILKDQGYHVWWGGKNDLVPGQGGFGAYCDVKYRPGKEDYARWGLTPRPNLHGHAYWRGEPGSDTYYSFYAGRLEKGDEPIYCDDDWAMVLGAIDYLRTAPADRPICLFLPLGYPHPPYGVEEPYFSMIDRSKLPKRVPTPQNWEGKPSILKGIYQNQRMQTWTEDRWTELRATYYGQCARVDAQFGMLMDALRETGRYDDSAVFLFADHGDFTGDYGLVEKTQNTFEDCLSRVPLVVKPPKRVGVRAGVRDALVELVDFPATVFAMAGIEPGYDHFGKSLVPLLRGQAQEHRDAVFCEGGRRPGERQAMELESKQCDSPEGMYYPRLVLQAQDAGPEHHKAVMCRTKTHKYVYRMGEMEELYDLRSDPGEVRNVAGKAEYAGVLSELRQRMLRFMVETADVVPREADRR